MSDIRFEQAIYINENRDEIEKIVTEFKEITPRILCNTVVQMTNPDLIERIMEAGDFVYNGDITPTSLKLVLRCLEEAKDYVSGPDFKRCENSVRELASLIGKIVSEIK